MIHKQALYVTIAVPLTVLLSNCTSISNGTTSNIADICEQTVRAYGPLRDQGPVEDYGALFTEDATFTLGGNVTRGREVIMARQVAVNAQNTFVHFMQDVQIDESLDNPRGETRFNIYIGAKDVNDMSIHRQIIGRYKDIFDVSNNVCRIASRDVEIIFDTAGSAPIGDASQ